MGRLRRLVVSAGLALLPFGSADNAAAQPAPEQIAVLDSRFFAPSALHHNVPRLVVARGGHVLTADFAQFFSDTGGLTRWGYPTSEVLRETNSGTALTQYYQRGVIDWHQSDTCDPPGSICFERRLSWDSFGGGANGSPDMGVEPELVNANDGVPFGPWGHEVSDVSVDGQPTGFLQFFNAYGGIDSFGYPKTDARYDDDPRAILHIPGATARFIRQYFQSAVMEYHPGEAEPVQLRLLGDDVRDATAYPDDAWKSFSSFRDATALNSPSIYHLERVRPGPRQVQAVVAASIPLTSVCSALSWQPGTPFCPPSAFVEVVPYQQLWTGDVVHTQPASPALDAQALLQMLGAAVRFVMGHDSTVAMLDKGVNVQLGDIAGDGSDDSGVVVEAPGFDASLAGTLFLVSVALDAAGTTSTRYQVLEGKLVVNTVPTAVPLLLPNSINAMSPNPLVPAFAVAPDAALSVRTEPLQLLPPQAGVAASLPLGPPGTPTPTPTQAIVSTPTPARPSAPTATRPPVPVPTPTQPAQTDVSTVLAGGPAQAFVSTSVAVLAPADAARVALLRGLPPVASGPVPLPLLHVVPTTPEFVDLSQTKVESSMSVGNSGTAPLLWTVAADPNTPWVGASPTSGTLNPGEQTTVRVALVQKSLPGGGSQPANGSLLVVAAPGGSASVPVRYHP